MLGSLGWCRALMSMDFNHSPSVFDSEFRGRQLHASGEYTCCMPRGDQQDSKASVLSRTK